MEEQNLVQNQKETEKKKYKRPEIHKVEIDTQISMVMMSGAGGTPGGGANPFNDPTG